MRLCLSARRAALALTAAALSLGSLEAGAPAPADRFREANELVRNGDYPKGIALYEELVGSGIESASLYWNWAQAAIARGAQGEALWALLRARELDPADRAVQRALEGLREGANLDRAEIAPEPLAAVARGARRFRLDLIALVLLFLSLGAHAGLRLRPPAPRLAPAAWTALLLGLAVAAIPVAGGFRLRRPPKAWASCARARSSRSSTGAATTFGSRTRRERGAGRWLRRFVGWTGPMVPRGNMPCLAKPQPPRRPQAPRAAPGAPDAGGLDDRRPDRGGGSAVAAPGAGQRAGAGPRTGAGGTATAQSR